MQTATAIDILTRQGLSRDGDAFHAPDGAVVSVYVANGSQSLVLDKIASITITGDVALIATARKEVYGIELSDLRAVRVTPESASPGYR